MRVAVSAGEPSGRLFSALLTESLVHLSHDVEIDDISTGMAEVVGHWEGLRQAGEHRDVLDRTAARVIDSRPDVLVPIGYPGLNLPLAARVRSAGIPVVYVAPPQVWAWGGFRVRALRRASDRCVCLFPFEQSFLRRAGVNAVFVGYPLTDAIDEALAGRAASQTGGTGDGDSYVALLPGSRKAEVVFHRPVFERVANLLEDVRPDVRSVFGDLKPAARPGTQAGALRRRYDFLAGARCAVVVSGTATLETALLGVPEIACYHLPGASRLLARLLVRTKWFALPNILLGEQSIPELLEPEANELVALLVAMLEDDSVPRRALERRARLRAMLGPPGASDRIAEVVLDTALRRSTACQVAGC